MRFGVSSACLYPMDTLSAFDTLQGLEVQNIEVFINTFSELYPKYINTLKEHKDKMATCITSLHPFSCELESLLFATEYEARFKDGLNLYKKYFVACEKLDITKMAFHGMYLQNTFSFEAHCKYYAKLRKAAADYGVDFCYENVVRCKCGRPENIELLRNYTNDEVSFLLDVKQMRRANVPMEQMLYAMRGKIKYVHLSDYSAENDCIIPFDGLFDFKALFTALINQKFDGDIILELYRNGFNTADALKTAVSKIKNAYQKEEGTLI